MKEIEAIVLGETVKAVVRVYKGDRTTKRVVVKKKLSDYIDEKGRIKLEKIKKDVLNEVDDNV